MTRAPLIVAVLLLTCVAACGASGRASLGSRAGLVAGAAVAGPPGAMAGSALGAGIGAMTTKAKPVTVLGAAAGGALGPTGASLGATGGELIDAHLEKKQLAHDKRAAETRIAAEEAASATSPAATVDVSTTETSSNAAVLPDPAPLEIPPAGAAQP